MSTLKKTIMETSLSKPVQQASTVNKIVAWFFNENNLFTSLMEGKSVTNAKLLCTVNVLFASYILLRFLSYGYSLIAISLAWFVFAIFLYWKVK